MIIREHADGLLLITQPDHAALAARMMEPWIDGLAASPRRTEILGAIAAHDNGWLTIDAAPIVDAAAGTLRDFMQVPDDIRQGVWPRSVALASHAPYSAALIAQHAVHIFERYRGRHDWQPFFAQMESLRAEQLARAGGVTLDTLVADYRYLRLADLLSLTFCNQWREPQGEEHGHTIRLDAGRVTITPDPFGGREVPISVTGRLMPPPPFASAEAAASAWASAPRVTVEGVLKGV